MRVIYDTNWYGRRCSLNKSAVAGSFPMSDESTRKRRVEVAAAPLTTGKLNAVRAAIKAGVTPSRIARQFGISQSDVRKALASETKR